MPNGSVSPSVAEVRLQGFFPVAERQEGAVKQNHHGRTCFQKTPYRVRFIGAPTRGFWNPSPRLLVAAVIRGRFGFLRSAQQVFGNALLNLGNQC